MLSFNIFRMIQILTDPKADIRSLSSSWQKLHIYTKTRLKDKTKARPRHCIERRSDRWMKNRFHKLGPGSLSCLVVSVLSCRVSFCLFCFVLSLACLDSCCVLDCDVLCCVIVPCFVLCTTVSWFIESCPVLFFLSYPVLAGVALWLSCDCVVLWLCWVIL